jgi:hypothetical protein
VPSVAVRRIETSKKLTYMPEKVAVSRGDEQVKRESEDLLDDEHVDV